MQTIQETYLALIEDTICYIKGLLPRQEKLPPAPAPKKVEPAPQTPPTKIEKPSPPTQKKLPSGVELNPPSAPVQESFEKIRRSLAETAPHLYLHDAPLPDEKAKWIRTAWKEKNETPAVPILFQGTQYRTFLDNVAKAISLSFLPSRVIEIEKEKKWDAFLESPQLKLILIPDHLLFSSKELLRYYKENPGQKTRYLGNIPLLLLPDLSLYFKDPYLKCFLWNIICQLLKDSG